ncbi:hypothetical protein F5X68DRAFT_14376 [Plectosphaerella plurivora]|uniref:Cyclase n=1 Tax=Plectosphaerella plurivora TaxID=936078 RepID=A0A9P8VBT2_9PEZI|nr:hypothetical protein F5X68DRAFT_14376 [Plectosphaerella plurivora]
MSATAEDIPLGQNGIPSFDSLPLRKGDPPYSAWGLYGPNDELGTLNRLTDERVLAAAQSEIRTGARVSLNWPLDAQAKGTFFSRQGFHQQLIDKSPRFINDDVWTFNTQCSSQWDGLRHYGYQKERRFYNNVEMDAVHGLGPDGERSTINGIQAMQEKGIVGRGILVDYHAWRLNHPDPSSLSPYDPFSSTQIPLSDIQACLAAQGTTPRFGDILFTRTGFMAVHATKTPEEIATLQAVLPPTFGGLQQSDATLSWIWENFSAVAGDQPSFESWPSAWDPAGEGKPFAMHEVLLAGWGCPIGELFDLEALSKKCKAEGRWSFFVTSEPCNVPGGVASPPNILALF